MTELYLSDLMKLGGIDPDEAVLIRHSVGDIAFAKCYENGSESIEQYTRLQAEHFSDGFKYWLVFIGEKGRGARFFGAYTVKGKHPARLIICPQVFLCLRCLKETFINMT